MLIEAAVGDAYGLGFECADREFVEKFNKKPLNYITRKEDPTHFLKPGVYSDDTQMTIAICEAMISGEDWTPLNVANRFVECFKRDERRGYNGGFFLFLQNLKGGGQEFLDKIKPDSEKSGAAMRAMPLGLLRNVDDIRWKNQIQAALTHNTPNGINSAFTSALMTHYFYHKKGPKKDLTPWLEEITKCPLSGNWRMPMMAEAEGDTYQGYVLGERVRVNGWQCVEAAIHAIETSDSMTEVLQNCISYCGDVDTVATIALAAASWATDIEQDIQANNPLWDGLENGTFGRDYLSTLEEKLLSCVGGPKHGR